MRNLNIRKQLKDFASKEPKSHDGNYNKNLFPPIKDYSGKIVTPGYNPKKAAKYKKNANK